MLKIYSNTFLFLIILLFPCNKISAQTLNYKNNNIQYEIIVEDSLLTKDDIYKYSKRWVADSFKDSKHVLRVDDQQNGEILGVGLIKLSADKSINWSRPSVLIEFNFVISVKEGKSRLRFYDLKDLTIDSFADDGYSRLNLESRDQKNMKKKGNSLKAWLLLVDAINSGFQGMLVNYQNTIIDSNSDDF